MDVALPGHRRCRVPFGRLLLFFQDDTGLCGQIRVPPKDYWCGSWSSLTAYAKRSDIVRQNSGLSRIRQPQVVVVDQPGLPTRTASTARLPGVEKVSGSTNSA